MIRVLIAEDSITQREILARVLRGDQELVLVGEAHDGAEAVARARELSPDVVLMDVHMDRMNGIDATRQIMREHPLPVVIMSSTLRVQDVDLAVEAMRVGAVAVIEKPKGAALLHLPKIAPRLYRVLREAANTPVQQPSIPAHDVPRQHKGSYRPPSCDVKVIGICASAGGPSVLVEILSSLPAAFPIPILLVQHISAGFEQGFANWLAKRTGQTAQIANEKQRLSPGVWLGSTNQHIVLKTPCTIGIVPRQPGDIHCPSGDVLLKSIADQCSGSAVGIVLTGMGDDGTRGLLALKHAGGQTIIQNEATAMVWGMPRAAKQAGAFDYELSPAEIAAALRTLVHG